MQTKKNIHGESGAVHLAGEKAKKGSAFGLTVLGLALLGVTSSWILFRSKDRPWVSEDDKNERKKQLYLNTIRTLHTS